MSEKNFIKKTLTETVMTRRSFLKWSAALGGTAALAGGLKFGLRAAQAAAQTTDEGQWILAACWHNCGGRCPNYALVKDGVVVRQKTDDTHPDSPDFPQQRGCARGRSQRHQAFGADRIKYPMKRKHWEPGGGDKSMRGRDEWVRISWDEALDLVANELKRIKEAYGNESIMLFGRGGMERTLALYGGYAVATFGTVSWGTWRQTGPMIGLGDGFYVHAVNDRMDLRKSQLVVVWGGDYIWSSGGNPTYNYLQAKKAGAKFIFIDPFYNDTAQVLADEWIPIRPSTDHTMALAMAYTLITEDDPATNPLIAWDFLNRCTVGFDADHLPEGADPKVNFKDYVLGTYDGQPKTPEWAAVICGVPPETIRNLAREIATTKNVALHTAFACARINNGDSWPQAFMALGAMTGHIGREGSATGPCSHNLAGNGGPALVRAGGSGVPGIQNPLKEPLVYGMGAAWDAILNGKYVAGKDTMKDIDIHCIYYGASSMLNQSPGMTKGIEAHRKVDFVVTQNYVLNTNAKYSDIVLPATTQWERYGGFLSGNREILIFYSQITDPLFEAKDDIWMAKEIGQRLGLDPNEIDPIPLKQQVFNQLAGATVIKNDGSGYEPLVTITAEDITALGVDGKPQTGRIPYKEFKEKGIYQVPRTPGDNLGYIAHKAFVDDPESNPLDTTSGKLELYCQAIVDFVEAKGYTEIDPIPTYTPRQEGYEDTFADWKNKVKGDYPFQLVTIHYARRSHSIFDNIGQLRRAFPQELMLNALDAKRLGIQSDDTILVSSRWGKVLRHAYVTNRVTPGVVLLGEGAWAEVDEGTGIDKAGATNTLDGPIVTGQGTEGWNTCNVQVEKWSGKPLEADYKWPHRVPIHDSTDVPSDEWHLEPDVINPVKEA
jgi:anaerobic dimethyl sulfoxide reductase subunit A